MVKQLKYSDVEIDKKFHCSKKAFNVNKVDLKKILTSNQFAYGKNKETDAK